MTEPVNVDEAAVCRWLSRFYARELDETTIAVYRSGGAAPIFAYLTKHQRLVSHVKRIERDIEAWSELSEPRLELACDFAGLFLGDGRTGALPYASFYCGAEGRLFQAPHERMATRLRAINLRVREDLREPADHLAVMLEYLASRLEMGKVRPRVSTSEENCGHFVRTELLTWLPAFLKRANETATATDLYKAVISLTVDYLEGLVKRADD